MELGGTRFTAATEVIGHPLGLSEVEIQSVMDPNAIVAARKGPGGAAPRPVQAMLDEVHQAADAAEVWRREKAAQLATAEERLIRTAREAAGLTP